MDRFPADRAPARKVRIAVTPDGRYGDEYTINESQILSHDDFQHAYDFVRLLPDYVPTPLIENDVLADECRVSSVLIKDEGRRLPTHSFKVLGPPYALARQLLSRLDPAIRNSAELIDGKLKPEFDGIVACAATSGNHGRALAWAATQFGCQCHIYMPESTGTFREEKIKRFGGTTIRVPGTYDESVSRAVQESQQPGHVLVGDGADPTSNVLRHIVHGYSILGEELIASIQSDAMPTHVFIPAGSGSLAAAVTARLWMEYGPKRPKTIIVQPHAADSGYQSCLSATRVASTGDLGTIMDGLSVGELSADAWTILSCGAFAFITICDDNALTMLEMLAQDARLSIGETGVAALAAFQAASHEPEVRRQLRLDENSKVILVATEGMTDPHVVNRLLSDLH